MALPRVSDNLPPYDPTKSSLAYGDRALPKLNRELQSRDLRVRQQALLGLADVLHKRENLASALKEGIVGSLKALLADEDELVRERAAKVLGNVAQHSLGRQAFLQEGIITALSKLFSDATLAVRINAHSAVEMCARTTEGAKGTVKADLVPLCVDKLVAEEMPQLKSIILETLHWCFVVDTTDGLACDGIRISYELLSHAQPDICGQAARILFDLTVPQEGKETACTTDGCISKLVELLDAQHEFARAQALGALMSIAVITDGKHAILSPELIQRVTELLEHQNSEIRLNAIKLLSLLAETPKGKESFKGVLHKLQELAAKDENDLVKKNAHTATTIITWTP